MERRQVSKPPKKKSKREFGVRWQDDEKDVEADGGTTCRGNNRGSLLMGLKNGFVSIVRDYNFLRKSTSSTYRVNTSMWSLTNSSTSSEGLELSDAGSLSSSNDSGFFRGRFRSSGGPVHGRSFAAHNEERIQQIKSDIAALQPQKVKRLL